MRYRSAGKRLKNILQWRPFQKLSEWAEENIVLVTGAIKGKLKLYRTPHVYRIFEELDKMGVKRVTIKSASQIAKTLIGNIFIAKAIDRDPNDMMIMIPTGGEELNRYMKKKVNPFMEGCKAVKDKIIEHKTTEKLRLKDTEKQFAGGSLSILGSAKPKTISVKYALFDEVAEFKRGAVGEALERMKTFLDYGGKALLTSTTISPDDEINYYFDTSEVKIQYWYTCHECEESFYPDELCLVFPSEEEYREVEGIERELFTHEVHSKYKPYAMKNGKMECPHCETQADNATRLKQILGNKCEWVQVIKVQKDEDDETSGVYVRADEIITEYSTIGIDANSLCSMFVPLSEFVDKTISCGEDTIQLNKFYTGYYNKNYENKSESIKKADILLLSNGLQEGVIPRGTVKLYMGVDTQKYGFWYEVKAYTYGFKSHTVAYGYIDSFDQIEVLFQKEWQGEDGDPYYIDKMGIDRLGNRTSSVDQWVRTMVDQYGLIDQIYGIIGYTDNRDGKALMEVIISKDISNGGIAAVPYKALRMNNWTIKTTLQDTINNNINNKKEAENEEYEQKTTRLFFVNQTIVDDAAAKEKSVATDYERQLSSERVENGAFVKKSVHNHLWDTSCICTTLAEQDFVPDMRDPIEKEAENEAMWNAYTK